MGTLTLYTYFGTMVNNFALRNLENYYQKLLEREDTIMQSYMEIIGLPEIDDNTVAPFNVSISELVADMVPYHAQMTAMSVTYQAVLVNRKEATRQAQLAHIAAAKAVGGHARVLVALAV
jgi:hypothetical protein